MTDTTTAAIIARCDHIEHCAMNQHHQDADRMRALVAERDTLAKQAEDCARTCAEQAEEIQTLTGQLAEARNAALEEAAEIVRGSGSPGMATTERLIRALKSEPAPRQSVQEAAKVLLTKETGMSDELNSAGWEFIEAWRDIVQEPLSPMAFNHCKPMLRRVFDHYLRALAQET